MMLDKYQITGGFPLSLVYGRVSGIAGPNELLGRLDTKSTLVKAQEVLQ